MRDRGNGGWPGRCGRRMLVLAAAELRLTTPLEIVTILTLLALLPAALASLTPFLRITLVLHFLRQALGTQTAPSNPVLLGLGLFLTLLVMQPVARELQAKSLDPYAKNELTLAQALEAAHQPVQTFLLRFAREKDIQLFLDLTKTPPPKRPQDVELRVLMPAYVLSELRTGFQIGAVLFLPFLIIDLVVASVTLSIGMVQLPPVMVAAPFKILLFVLVDGWNLVIGSLMRSFQ